MGEIRAFGNTEGLQEWGIAGMTGKHVTTGVTGDARKDETDQASRWRRGIVGMMGAIVALRETTRDYG